MVAIGFGNYFSALLFGKEWSSGFYLLSFPVILALFTIVSMGYINYRGIEISSKVNVPATLFEVGGLFFIVWAILWQEVTSAYPITRRWQPVLEGLCMELFSLFCIHGIW